MARPTLAGPDSDPGTPALATAETVVAFWRAAGPRRWFSKDASFDATIREEFGSTHEAAAHGRLDTWRNSAVGALGLVLLLDQFSRNLWRGSARAFACDPLARAVAREALACGHDLATPPDMRLFFYLPYSHSEAPDDQDQAVALGEALEQTGGPSAGSAREHRDIIRRFGRFPHRNAVLGRLSNDAEATFLAKGGFAG